MRTAVLGAGIIGTTTAYYLARLGHEVVVVDRQPDVGLETSFANGGLVVPSMSDPWAAPDVPKTMLKWLGRDDAPLLLRPSALPGLAMWGLRFLRNCTHQRWRSNARTILRVATYSRDELDRLTAETDIVYDRSTTGGLRVFRDSLSMDSAKRSADMLDELGVAFRVLDTEGCLRIEPALRPAADKIAGAIHFPDDHSGDAYKFTCEMARLCRSMGVEFRFGTTVIGFESLGDVINSVRTRNGRIEADRYVLALGSYSPTMSRRIGFRIPVYPVKGYSITVSAAGWNDAPTVPVVDYGRKVGITPLGDRLRVGGTAEFSGYDTSTNARRGALLMEALTDLFPGFTAQSPAEHWAGLRPMTPDGVPILGPSPYRNLYLNTGQGHLGWTMACGSARVIADLMSERTPEIDLEGMTLARIRPISR